MFPVECYVILQRLVNSICYYLGMRWRMNQIAPFVIRNPWNNIIKWMLKASRWCKNGLWTQWDTYSSLLDKRICTANAISILINTFFRIFFSLILAITDHKFTIDPGRDSVAQLQESCTKFRFISNASWPEPKFNRSMLITYWFIRLVSHSQHSRAHNVANRPILIDSFYWPKNKENSYIEEIQVTGEF